MDIGTEELSHLEIVGCLARMHLKPVKGFAIVFSLMVKRSILIAFIGASLAWLVVSVATWCVRRKMRSVRKARAAEKKAAPRFREAATVDQMIGVRPRSKPSR